MLYVPVRSARFALVVPPALLLGVFKLPPFAIIVNGLPLNAPNTPLNCQSLASALPMLPYPLVLCHGSAYTNPSCRLCRRSNPAGPQLRHRRSEERRVGKDWGTAE